MRKQIVIDDVKEVEVDLANALLNVEAEGNVYDVTNAPNAYQPLPNGYYVAQVTKTELTNSKSSGSPMINITFTVEEPFEYAGRMLFDRLVHSPKSTGVNKSKLEALGIKVPAQMGDNHFELLVDLLLETKPVSLKVVTEASTGINPSTGEPYAPKNVVKAIKPLNDDGYDD